MPFELDKAEGMSLDELRAAAVADANGEVVAVKDEPIPAKDAEKVEADLDNSDEAEEVDDEPVTHIYRREIDNGNGSVDVYEADSLEALVDKIAEGKRNANIKLREVIAEKRAIEAKTTQVNADDAFVLSEQLKKNPEEAIAQVVLKTLTRQQAKIQEAQDAQSRFVATHPTYVPNPANGKRLVAWLQANGHAEITYDGLEKAYQDLNSSGLLEVKVEGAEVATATEATETQQTVAPKAEVTQRPSPKRSSSIRTTARVSTVVNTQPSEDEAYSMPLDQLRALANKQLAGGQS